MAVDMMIIAAHPDDAELGMGGFIHACTSAGKQVMIVDLTDGEPTPYGSPEQRAAESLEASRILGVSKRLMLSMPNRALFDTVENRKVLASVIREYRPEVLFIPYWEDAHPDHLYAERLATAARFYAKFVKSDMPFAPHYPRKVFHYYSVHLHVKLQPSFVFDISAHFEAKMQALSAYHSQFSESHNTQVFERIESGNAYWGEQVGCRYGEPFTCLEHLRIADCNYVFTA